MSEEKTMLENAHGTSKVRMGAMVADTIERLIRERDEAERRGYLKGLSDAQLAIHHADVLWAHSRAIDALKAKAKE